MIDRGSSTEPTATAGLGPGAAALRWIIAFNLLSTSVHYAHNFVRAQTYPPVFPFFNATAYQVGIAIFWPLLTYLGLRGYRLYREGEVERARPDLIAYAMLGFTSLGHFLGGNPDIPPFFYVTMFTDFLAGSALLVFVGWTYEQLGMNRR